MPSRLLTTFLLLTLALSADAAQPAAPARADLAAEIQAMELRRSGQSAMAAALTEENALRKEAAALARNIPAAHPVPDDPFHAFVVGEGVPRMGAG